MTLTEMAGPSVALAIAIPLAILFIYVFLWRLLSVVFVYVALFNAAWKILVGLYQMADAIIYRVRYELRQTRKPFLVPVLLGISGAIGLCASAIWLVSLNHSLNQGVHASTSFPATPATPVLHTTEMPVRTDGDMSFIVATVNGLEMPFMIDSGSSTVCLPDSVIGDLRRRGLLTDADVQGSQNAGLADGRVVRSKAYNLAQVTIGAWALNGVAASSCGKSKVALLGQSVLGRFTSWSLDNQRNVLMLTAPKG
jgi:predicted aspartyl protease